MRTYFDRFISDLRDAGRWTGLLFLAVMAVSSLTTYMSLFAIANLENGTLLAPHQGGPVSTIRVFDPQEAIVRSPELASNGFETPAMQTLLEAMEEDGRLSLLVPASMLISDRLVSTDGLAPDARVLVRQTPASWPDSGMLWGDLGADGRPVVDDSHIAEIDLRQADVPLPVDYVAGTGQIVDLADRPLILLSVSQASQVGFSGLERHSELLAGVTCRCAATELAVTADAMTRAASRSDEQVVYYAVSSEGLIGRVQRAAALSDVLDVLQGLCAILALAMIGTIAGRLFWRRRSRVFGIEAMCGARESAIQLRYHSLIALSFTVPLLIGVVSTNGLVAASAWPPPLPRGWISAVAAGACLVHLAIAAPNMWRIHMLCRYPTEG